MNVGHVAQVWRYPVKSMRGERVERTEVTHTGLAGDRAWALRDPDTGLFLSAKRHPALLGCAARTEGDEVFVDLPDGRTLPCADPDAVSAAVSELVGRKVELVAPAAVAEPAYDLPSDLAAGEGDTLAFPCPPGTAFDLSTLHVIADATLRHLAGLYPEGNFDVRRFRPNVLVACEGSGFVEDAWLEGTLRIGDVSALVLMPTIRCVMTTREQPGLPRDKGILRTAAVHHGLNLGLNANVTGPGTIAVGDTVRLDQSA